MLDERMTSVNYRMASVSNVSEDLQMIALNGEGAVDPTPVTVGSGDASAATVNGPGPRSTPSRPRSRSAMTRSYPPRPTVEDEDTSITDTSSHTSPEVEGGRGVRRSVFAGEGSSSPASGQMPRHGAGEEEDRLDRGKDRVEVVAR